ncbi:MAG: cbb3-type cytochrome c oxidase subunit I [Crocinitomicaceae bacterium]|nr:cbb3-type cytochrome c oxidase subunit I [Crocinitomicaceae bacterium]
MEELTTTEYKKQRKLIIVWGITFLVVFPLLVTLGMLMRISHAELADISAERFYSFMTLHGLGMIGLLFSFAFAGIWYLLSTRYVKLKLSVGYFVYITVLLSVIGLAVAALIGKFGPGWYLLYPLPFIGGSWPVWTTGLSTVSLLALGVGWLIGILHVLYAMAKEYGGFTNMLGWQYIKNKEDKREIPVIVLASTISLVPGVLAILAGAVLLIMYLLQVMEPSLNFDALMLKNIVMFFGHTIANITMYCAVTWVYTLLPEYTKRPWYVDKVLVYSWNATFFFVCIAFLHHMYMDLEQPLYLQIIGQVASYSSAIPATAITMFGIISQLYHSRVKWGVVPLTFLFGAAGWAIGGLSAVVDSTISFNKVLHNTLWVPAHFHTYMLLGVVLFIFGYLYYVAGEKKDIHTGGVAKLGLWTYIIGAAGFLLMFYYGGMNSVPRRYNTYSGMGVDATHQAGVYGAKIAVFSIGILFIGLLIMYVTLFLKLTKKDETKNLD